MLEWRDHIFFAAEDWVLLLAIYKAVMKALRRKVFILQTLAHRVFNLLFITCLFNPSVDHFVQRSPTLTVSCKSVLNRCFEGNLTFHVFLQRFYLASIDLYKVQVRSRLLVFRLWSLILLALFKRQELTVILRLFTSDLFLGVHCKNAMYGEN